MIVTAQTASPTRPPDIKTFAAPPRSRFLPSSAWRTSCVPIAGPRSALPGL